MIDRAVLRELAAMLFERAEDPNRLLSDRGSVLLPVALRRQMRRNDNAVIGELAQDDHWSGNCWERSAIRPVQFGPDWYAIDRR